ncbi:MAG TPA: hypothetical protein VIK10_00195 [Prolixibacteraceae bacterium]
MKKEAVKGETIMNKTYTGKLQCINCGSDSQFEINDDKSFVKCISCGREYPGGETELVKLNVENLDHIKNKIAEDYTKIIIEKMNPNQFKK